MSTKMRPIRDTIPLDDARAIIDGKGSPIDRRERVPLHQAGGRVLAEDIVAASDVPPFARAGMDGYAVRAADVAGAGPDAPVRLRVTAVSAAAQSTVPSNGSRCSSSLPLLSNWCRLICNDWSRKLGMYRFFSSNGFRPYASHPNLPVISG